MVSASPTSIDWIDGNARDLEAELAWFASLLDTRFELHVDQNAEHASVFDLEPPDLSDSNAPYGRFVSETGLPFVERVALVLALVPHIRPQLLDVFFTKNRTFDRRCTEFGGSFDIAPDRFVPTGETLMFVLAGSDLEQRFAIQARFDSDHDLLRNRVLEMAPGRSGDSDRGGGNGGWSTAPLTLTDEFRGFFTVGEASHPHFGADFPALRISTELTWDDLVLHPGTRRQVEEIETWIAHGATLMDEWGMAPKLRPGHRALFHGPPGTGKTMTACLLGKYTGRDVYRVDLSRVVSKYIGETEKNLARVFDLAQHKEWILFFDEADALFGKRSDTKDSHDRYANQEVSFLLQRIETFDGIAILASNRRDDLDAAFARRFESMIHFPIPRPDERLRLWRQAFSKKCELESTVDLTAVADEHALSGGAIINVVRFASLEALAQGTTVISNDSIRRGIRREQTKEGQQV